MKVSIKSFDVNMEVKTKGITFKVSDNNGKHQGNLVLTKTRLTWCQGNQSLQNGKRVSWDDFISWMNGGPK